MGRLALLGRCALTAASALLGAAPLSAQSVTSAAPKSALPVVTWCDAVAVKPQWAQQTVYLNLSHEAPDTEAAKSRQRFSTESLNDVLLALVTQYRAQLLTQDSSSVPIGDGSLRSANGRYSPGALLGYVQFDMNASAHIGNVVLSGARDSTLAHELTAAVTGVATERSLADSVQSARHTMKLSANLRPDTTGASWPLFTLFVPRSREVGVTRRAYREYPKELLGWNGGLQFDFFVDTAGRAEKKTIRPVPSPDSVTFDSDAQRNVYLGLIRFGTTLAQESRFTAANIWDAAFGNW